jgi:hypothetical protein
MAVLRHNEANPWMTQRGSDNPDLEVLGPNTLPLCPSFLNIRSLRQPVAAREFVHATRRRTSSGAEQSNGDALFSGAGSALHAPILSPFASGTHECEYGACYGDGTSACPLITPFNALEEL